MQDSKSIDTKEGTDINSQAAIWNRIEALGSLARLLMRELESLQNMPRPQTEDSGFKGGNFMDQVQQYEVGLISQALIRTKGQQREAAKLLGIKPSTLNAKLKRYGISSYDFSFGRTNGVNGVT